MRAPSQAASLSWRPPSTPVQLLSYLLGTWSVSKEMQYTRGGKTGTFAGQATFAWLDCDMPTIAFEEKGMARLAPEDQEYSARHRLLYMAPTDDPTLLQVCFDEARERDSAAAIIAGSRFFHTIEYASMDAYPPPFDHPCGPDMYRGRIALDDEQTFRLLWRVSGPRKLGSVTSTFRREGEGPGEEPRGS